MDWAQTPGLRGSDRCPVGDRRRLLNQLAFSELLQRTPGLQVDKLRINRRPDYYVQSRQPDGSWNEDVRQATAHKRCLRIISFRCLNRCVAEQKLDLLQLTATLVLHRGEGAGGFCPRSLDGFSFHRLVWTMRAAQLKLAY